MMPNKFEFVPQIGFSIRLRDLRLAKARCPGAQFAFRRLIANRFGLE
jgi:hypothetical protein